MRRTTKLGGSKSNPDLPTALQRGRMLHAQCYGQRSHKLYASTSVLGRLTLYAMLTEKIDNVDMKT